MQTDQNQNLDAETGNSLGQIRNSESVRNIFLLTLGLPTILMFVFCMSAKCRRSKREEKVILQQSIPVNKDMIMQETMGDMKGYIATRQAQIDALEKKEKELIDRIQKTQANQNALIQRQVQEVSKPNRSSRDVLSKAGLDLDTMDPLVYEIDDICARQGGQASNIHPTKWKRY